MRRFLSLAKYLPAVACKLLVVAWVVSLFWAVEGSIRLGDDAIRVTTLSGSVMFSYVRKSPNPASLRIGKLIKGGRTIFGRFVYFHLDVIRTTSLGFPIPFAATVFLPLALGPFTHYRFPLWSWFAFTALVAVELAFYLR